MQRLISTLLTSLLFAAATVPNAMAQVPQSSPSVGLFISSAATVEPPAAAATMPAAAKTDVVPAPLNSQVDSISTSGAETSRSSVDRPHVNRPSANSAYPAYCPSLPPGTQPGDWDYREALSLCLYGS